jgi:hypothetical protein
MDLSPGSLFSEALRSGGPLKISIYKNELKASTVMLIINLRPITSP